MARSEYAVLKSATNNLKSATRKILAQTDYGDSDLGLFTEFDLALENVKSVPRLKNIPNVQELYRAVEISKKKSWWSGSENYLKEAAGILRLYADPVLVDADSVAAEIKPSKTPHNKEAIAPIVGRYSGSKPKLSEKVREYAAGGGEGMSMEEDLAAWSTLQPLQAEQLRYLGAIIRIDPDLAVEESYINAMKKLTYEGRPSDLDWQVAEEKRENFISAVGDVETFMGAVGFEYNLPETGFENPELRRLEEELRIANSKIERLTTMDGAKIVPKRGDYIDKLAVIPGGIMMRLGSNSQAYEMKLLADDSLKYAGKVVFIDLDEKGPTPQEMEFIILTDRFRKAMDGLRGDATLNDGDKDIARDYARELQRFLKSRSP